MIIKQKSFTLNDTEPFYYAIGHHGKFDKYFIEFEKKYSAFCDLVGEYYGMDSNELDRIKFNFQKELNQYKTNDPELSEYLENN